MFISVRELQIHRIEFDETFAPGAIDLGPDLRQSEPLKSAGRADLIEENRGGRQGTIADIRLVGGFKAQLEASCARCLNPVPQSVDRQFDLLYRPIGVDRKSDEQAIDEADTEIGYYQGEGLQLEDVLREQVLLAVPLKVTCREDCRGLCPQCGKNLNQEQCSCSTEVEDPRWAALKEVRGRLEH